MRPEILFSLFKPVTNLPGIGPRLEKLLSKAAGSRIVDLLWHLPTGLIDRSLRVKIADAPIDHIATLNVHVDAHHPSGNRRHPYRVICSDETGFITLTFFHAHTDYLQKTLREGSDVVISGRVEMFNDERQMTHPDHIVPKEKEDELPIIEPVYRLTAGLSAKVLQKALSAALEQLPDLPEWQDPPWRQKNDWPSWYNALQHMHKPSTLTDIAQDHPNWRRLAYDEILANQLALRLIRLNMTRQRGRANLGTGEIKKRVLAALPFSLTGDQTEAVRQIETDMASPNRMLRMLQGDVGSGKTLVALLAMTRVVENGAQAAFMAPTEILARQHYETLLPLAEAAGISLTRLTGRDKGRPRAQILEQLANGEIDIIVGTHALFQEDVEFKDLACIIIDEQHRFGVHQRLMLAEKGVKNPDILVMTATPIPRTLTMAYYGDMDVSFLREKPPGRQPITTRAVSLDKLTEVTDHLRQALASDARIYWVCPLVEESEVLDVAAAEERYAHLQGLFGDRVGLVHGRMKAVEKDAAMAKFQSGEFSILVATTVIEVGVDVPEATIIIIEHAERFGLSQLHQLRGRVGRGDKPSSCVLLYHPPLGETAKARINIMRETDDGFRIAEEDLRLRGPGDVLGVRQSGLPDFRIADLAIHQDLLTAARDDAEIIVGKDPELKSPRGEALRVLLYLFERDEAIQYLHS